jgi:hypothetical protein
VGVFYYAFDFLALNFLFVTIKMNVDIYVIHAAFLEVRKNMVETLEKKLSACTDLNVKLSIITDHDPDMIDLKSVNSLVDFAKPTTGEVFDALVKNLHIKQLSNALKHREALKKASASSNISIILEDDVIYGDDVDTKLVTLLKALYDAKDKWDIMFLGIPSLSSIPTPEVPFRPVKDIFKIIPCIDSYIVHPTSATVLLKHFERIKYITNVQFSYISYINPELKVMMSTVNCFADGTKVGVYISTLTQNNKLFLNAEYNKLSQIVNGPGETIPAERKAVFDELKSTVRFKNHPDILTLQAIGEMKVGDFAKAKELFDEAYTMYTKNECILNSESEFILLYSRIFKYVQDQA